MKPKEEGATCRGCGKPIVWAIDPDGKRIPLDPKPPVYRLWPSGCTVNSTDQDQCQRDRGAMVSHFATCPDANRFSGSNRAAPGRSVPDPFPTPESAIGSRMAHGGGPEVPPRVNSSPVGAVELVKASTGDGSPPIGPHIAPFDFDGEEG